MYILINDQQIYYQKVGKGKNLILLHGWGQDVSSFWGVLGGLKKDFTVWIVDLPGFGRSEYPKKDFEISDFADIIASFIEQNKINKAVLLGHSLGGNVSIKLAAKFPGLINKLILEDSSGIRPKRSFFRFLIYPLSKIFKYLFPNILGIKDRVRHKIYWALESDYLNAGNLKGTLKNILSEDLTVELPKIIVETLVLWGEKDKAVKLKYGNIMYEMIPNSKIEIIEGAGHFPHLENPKMFLYFLKDFAS